MYMSVQKKLLGIFFRINCLFQTKLQGEGFEYSLIAIVRHDD